ncbi:MAG: hypothetical protein VXY91_01910 [Bacteroidota bacterium]|nr:hypothetical protein [Bacteroidota bacterium]
MDSKEYQKFAHDVKNHLTGASLQIQVLSMLLSEDQKKDIALVVDEIQKASNKISEFQQKVKAAEKGSASTRI